MTVRKTETLPLLATFKALMEQGGVVAAAQALDISQSAVSKHLARLREAYGDELFVRTAAGMRPTARALAMSPRVEAILRELDALQEERPFDPSRLEGEFVLSTTDDVRCPLLPRLLARLDAEAPRLRMRFTPLEPDYSVKGLETGAVDLVISVNWHAPERLKQRRLRSDHFVCLMGAGHPLAREEMTLEAYAAARHILVAPLGMRVGHIDEHLAGAGLSRFVRLAVPDFFQITPEILGDRHLTTLPSRVAAHIAEEAGAGVLALRPLPFAAPRFDYYALWHERFDRDPRHIWLRDLARDALKD